MPDNKSVKLPQKQFDVLKECVNSHVDYTTSRIHSLRTFKALEEKGYGKVVHDLFFYINEAGIQYVKDNTDNG